LGADQSDLIAAIARSDTSSKSARRAKDFESCETVSIAESAQCPSQDSLSA
jgi:hypothetical protein